MPASKDSIRAVFLRSCEAVSKHDEFCMKNEELCIENEELCIKMMSHGDKPGEEFLFLYGFFPEGNPNDTVVLPFYVDGGSPELRAWQAQGKT